ncbi:hypothetical protein DRO51_03770 [Candidatus Bathyarchaeota archaeon]|nr:MAG: hypothetical protein DRO51_03770 [Candidatus Bathyarchaeota archaeon]
MEAYPNSPELVKHTLQFLGLKPADILLDIGSEGLHAYIIALEKYGVNICVTVEVNCKVLKEALNS